MADASRQVSEAMEAAGAAVSLDELQAASGRVQTALGSLAGKLDTQAARGPSAQRDLWRIDCPAQA